MCHAAGLAKKRKFVAVYKKLTGEKSKFPHPFPFQKHPFLKVE